MKIQLPLVLLITCALVSFPLIAETPVIDESENFALFDEQPIRTEHGTQLAINSDSDLTTALAKDTDPNPLTDPANLLTKLQDLQQEIQELRGQLEVQTRDLKLLQQQQLAFYKDLDQRIQGNENSHNEQLITKIETTNIPEQLVNHRTNAKPLRTNPADEQISYLAAYELVKNKRYDDALKAMQTFVQLHPSGGYTPNAQYWLGELYLVKNNYKEAIKHFDIVLKDFPTSSKTAACTLKTGFALAGLGKINEAQQTLKQVLKNYPDTSTAQLAQVKLESLKIDGKN